MLPATTAEDRENLLDEVLAAYLRSARQGQAPPRQVLLEQHPSLAEDLARFFADQDHLDRLAAPLRRLAPARPPLAAGCTVGDYELLAEVAAGGMGVVFKARQKGLNRVVAVKVLRGPEPTPAAWERFRVEAEAVAGLDHPHIVPVYEVGAHDGLPFFSMKFIEGGSLAGAKERFGHDPRGAARLLAAVARAVHHAHERGILHRDLKPSNVLLDPQGQPYVTDFGLAKRLAGPPAAEEVEPGLTPVPPGLTGAGGVVGTPAYMAPEQAQGLPPTTAADVWGLGAILYELLTDRPPFRGRDPGDTLRQVREQEPTPPRSLNAGVDRDLEAVCLACLRKDPAGRYASAREVAEDLDRYLLGQSVRVRAVGRLRRLARWCRRQPLIAGLSAALLVVFVTAFVLVLGQWRRAEANFQTAERQRERAEANLDAVEALLDDFGSRLTEQRLAAIPGSQPVRKEFLEAILKHYQGILAQRAEDPRLRSGVAATYYRIGQLARSVSSRHDALEAYDRARALYQELHEANPDDAAVRLRLALAVHRMGVVQCDLGLPAEAMESYERARTLLEGLRDHPQQREEARLHLAAACQGIGGLHMAAGRRREARTWYEENVALVEELLGRHPDSPSYRWSLAVSLDNLGNILVQLKEPAAARRCLDRARKLLEELNRSVPDHQAQKALAAIYLRIGSFQCGDKQYDAALQTLRPGRELLEKLMKANPSVLTYPDDLASLLRQMGHAYRDSGRHREALKCYQEAITLCEKVHQLDPASASFRRGVARSHFDAATVHMRDGRNDQAAAALKKARTDFRALVAAEPKQVDYRKSLSMTLNNLALVLRDKHPAEALEYARESRKNAHTGMDLEPANAQHRELFSTACKLLARLELQAGRPDAAAEAARARRGLWPDDPGNLIGIARDLALAAGAAGEHGPEYAAEAVRALGHAAAKGFKDAALLEGDKDLAGLRPRKDFQKLLEDLKRRQGNAAP
jgi:serine/threonine-protein kinase